MSTTTTIIIVGQAHQNDSGIIPTHLIQFTENDRPALILTKMDGSIDRKVIIPTIEHTIDDIFLMIAVFVLKLVNPSINIHTNQKISLYELLNEQERMDLYSKTTLAFGNTRTKVVLNIFDGSHLLGQLDQLRKYPNDWEVTLPAIKQEFNAWHGKVETKGF